MNETILKVEHLFHRYSRDWAISDINFEVKGTGVLGLLGSNGAGKSTTMNIICGVLKQTSGTVKISGIEIHKTPVKAKALIGFLPQVAPLYMDLTVDEYLTYCAYLRLMNKKSITAALNRVKEQCGIGNYSKRLIRNLSGGYRQRVGIAQAIIHRPGLVVLDEPTNGLDPNQIIGVRNLIKEIAEERAVIFSSHILSEIQAACKDIIMIEGGKVVFSDSMNAFYNYVESNTMLVSMNAFPGPDAMRAIEGITHVEIIDEKTCRLKFKNAPGISERIIEAGVANGWHLSEITIEKNTMEQVFAQLSKKRNPN